MRLYEAVYILDAALDEAAINEEQRLRDAEARRRSWMRSQFARIHVLNALASMNDGGGRYCKRAQLQ